MDRFAVFVDAGYLFAQGSVAITGSKKPRTELVLDAPIVIDRRTSWASKPIGKRHEAYRPTWIASYCRSAAWPWVEILNARRCAKCERAFNVLSKSGLPVGSPKQTNAATRVTTATASARVRLVRGSIAHRFAGESPKGSPKGKSPEISQAKEPLAGRTLWKVGGNPAPKV